MQGKQRTLLRGSIVALLLVTLTLTVWSMSGRNVTPAHAENNGVATTPFMGWSTWSFVGGYPTQANMEAQANVEVSKLKSHGYNYVLLDDHYYLNPGTTVDQYGRWQVNPA